MIYEKKYIQFNDFVFGTYDLVRGDDEPVQYKGSSTAYSYTHGSYRPLKNTFLYVSEKQVNMTVTLNTKKLPCEYRTHYVKFFEQEIGRPGKLWAIKNNELIWANAVANNVRPVKNGRQWQVTYDIEFVIPGGVWHKADKLKTFLLPYNPCTFMECKGFRDNETCKTVASEGGDCCASCIEKRSKKTRPATCHCCCMDEVCSDMALCYHTNELQKFYGCEVPYQIAYDCDMALEYFGDPYLGDKMCVEEYCEGTIAGRLYSDTDIPTEEMEIVIKGHMKNVEVEINGNVNVINGEYDAIRITPSGDVYSVTDCCEHLLDPSVWSVPYGMTYGWTINPLENSIIVRLNACCSMACVFITHDAITT